MADHKTPLLPLVLGAVLVVFLVLPVLILLTHGLVMHYETATGVWPLLQHQAVQDALRVSLLSTACTVIFTLILVTPVAWLLARRTFPGKVVLDTLLDLPIVLPPVVAGVALLLTFGRQGWLGRPLELAGISLAFSPVAVVLAQFFVSAPYYLRTAKAGFGAIDREAEEAAQTDGAGPGQVFWLITWPLAFPFLLEGMALTWTRALGEFGATLLFAGSLPGKTRTIPLAIYAALESDLAPALVLCAIMVLVAFGVLGLVRVLSAYRAEE